MKFTLALAALAGLSTLAQQVHAKYSVCGKDLFYVVGVRCGEDGPLQMVCGPPLDEDELCDLSNTKWAKRFCYEKGKPVPKVIIEEALTGCFSTSPGEPWDTLGVDLSNKFFCRNFPAEISDEVFESLETSDSFEGPDPLAQWDVDISADDPDDAIRVICGEGFEGMGVFASDGDCAAIVQAGCEDNSPATNTLSRDFFALNTGCATDTNKYKMTFDVAWANTEVDSGFDGCFYLDVGEVMLNVHVTDTVTPIAAVSFNACEDVTSTEFHEVSVDLGEVPVGTLLSAEISVAVTNAVDCLFDNALLIDNIKIVPH